MKLPIIFIFAFVSCHAEFQQKCLNDSTCPSYAECKNGTCSCKNGLMPDGLDFCNGCNRSTECVGDNVACIHGLCVCLYGIEPTLNSCFECQTNSNCPKYAECKNGNCTCYHGPSPSGYRSCNECSTSTDCAGKHVQCEDGKCKCIYGKMVLSDSCGECSVSTDCAGEYVECTYGKCYCKYAGLYSFEPCSECAYYTDCDGKHTECNDNHQCKCVYGGDYSKGTCYECVDDSNCSTKFADCSNHKCKCKHGKRNLGSDSCNECIFDDHCTASYSECNWDNRCICTYGGEVRSNGKLTSCSANTVGITLGVIGGAFFIAIIIAVVCALRRRRLLQAGQPTAGGVWIQTPGVVPGVPVAAHSYPPMYPAPQYQPGPSNQGYVNNGYSANQSPQQPDASDAKRLL